MAAQFPCTQLLEISLDKLLLAEQIDVNRNRCMYARLDLIRNAIHCALTIIASNSHLVSRTITMRANTKLSATIQ